MPKRPMVTRGDSIIWAAGFIEGEGFFAVKNNRRKLKDGTRSIYTSYELGANQVNIEPLRELQRIFGGRLHTRKNVRADGIPRRIWTGWVVTNRERILEITHEIAPYLSEDRRQRIPWLDEAARYVTTGANHA